jgi:hypothetical protein
VPIGRGLADRNGYLRKIGIQTAAIGNTRFGIVYYIRR